MAGHAWPVALRAGSTRRATPTRRALFGEEALPPDWVVVVEGRDTITRLADDLALAVHHAPAVRDLPAWRERYPPVNSGRAPWPGEGG